MSNLQAALDFLSQYPDAKLFPSRWGKPKGADKPTHCPLVAWSTGSSSDPEQIRKWLGTDGAVYACIALVQSDMSVLDVDRKNGKDGGKTLLSLELDHGDLPGTLQSATPSDGDHYLFMGACSTGVNKFGKGLDSPVMIPVPGSNVVGKGIYRIVRRAPAAPLPEWLKAIAGERRQKERGEIDPVGIEWDLPHNVHRAVEYLLHAPEAIEGDGGDKRVLTVAMCVRDFGVSLDKCKELMIDLYADKVTNCDMDWFETKIENAYRYALKPPGAATPETAFADIEPTEPALSNIERLNKEFSVATIGSKVMIIHEDTDDVIPLRKADFETLLQNQRVWSEGDKPKSIPLSKIWLESEERRRSRGICFRPEGCDEGWVNLWQGFALDPLWENAEERCLLYREHVEKVICCSDPVHIQYVWSWMAHLVQSPGGMKPGVALVLRGGRGTGKGMFVRPLLRIFGRHGIQLNNREHLTGRFNHHLSDKVLVFLDEAFWAGDKKSEGVLKGLITEPRIPVERKGVDTYEVDSYVRCIMASNEDWVVPAGPDERRFMVMDVGDEHKQDSNGYFKALAREIDNGGAEALLAWLLQYKVEIDLFKAPESAARLHQKQESLEAVYQWWLDCLHKGTIYDHEWPDFLIPRYAMAAYSEWAKSWPGRPYVGEKILSRKIYGPKGVCPGHRSQRVIETERENGYHIPALESARKNFEKFIGGAIEWDDFSEIEY